MVIVSASILALFNGSLEISIIEATKIATMQSDITINPTICLVCFIHIAMRILAVILAITGLILVMMAFLINPVVVSYSESRIHSMTVRAVNAAIGESLKPSAFTGLTIVNHDASGKIIAVSADIHQMNHLSGSIAIEAQRKLEKLAAERLSVPLGTFTGLPIFTGQGPGIPLRVIPVGIVYCTFTTEFIGRGINQTVHRIVLTTRTTVSLVMPLGTRNINAEIDVLLCENVIIGEVPEFFLTTSSNS